MSQSLPSQIHAANARIAAVLILGFALAGLAAAQQSNTQGLAEFRVNGQGDVGPYPYAASLPRGTNQEVGLSGLPNAPFYLAAATSALPSGVPLLGGLLDLNLNAGWVVVFDGLRDPGAHLDGSGNFTASLFLPSTATIGSSAAFQALMTDPTNTPHGARLTACCVATVVQGFTVVPITFGGAESGRPGTIFNLSTYGMTLPFYANTYSSVYVNSDGHVSFNGDDTNFTPTPAAFLSGPARAAPMWTDLDPGYTGAAVRVSVDTVGGYLGGPLPSIRVDWIQMAEWQNSGSRHTFTMDMNIVGDITVTHDPFNGAMAYSELMGITPGTGILPPAPNNVWSAQKNLSAMPGSPITGLPNEAFWEWFVPYPPSVFYNPWDMAGTVTNFFAIGAGATGAYYIGS